MQEYLENGARLGWLIDPQNQRVEIYRPGREVEVLEQPMELSGEDVLPGFVLNLRRIWR
jgi:Uma2 family endonuclease